MQDELVIKVKTTHGVHVVSGTGSRDKMAAYDWSLDPRPHLVTEYATFTCHSAPLLGTRCATHKCRCSA